jgi:hypothetical protein
MPDTSSIFYQIGQSTKSAIAAEETRALAAEATLQTNINSEASSRASADTTLQSNIDSEASSRSAADSTLQGNIDTEASSRASADTALQSEIDATQSGAGLGAGGSYTANGLTNYITSVSTLVGADEALDAQIKTNADAISSEASTRASADTTLQSNIDSEASARSSADTTLQGNIDTEAASRASADTTLQSNIDAEETARIAAVSGEATARASADTTLQANIDSEASTARAAESALDAAKANLSGASFTGDVSGTNLVLSGNLTVQGTTTSLETTNSQVKDAIMLLNDGAASSANNGNDAGFIIERGASDDGNIAAVYDEGEDKFAFYKTSAGATSTDISGDDVSATLIDVKANDVVLGDGNNLGSLADFTAAMA